MKMDGSMVSLPVFHLDRDPNIDGDASGGNAIDYRCGLDMTGTHGECVRTIIYRCNTISRLIADSQVPHNVISGAVGDHRYDRRRCELSGWEKDTSLGLGAARNGWCR